MLGDERLRLALRALEVVREGVECGGCLVIRFCSDASRSATLRAFSASCAQPPSAISIGPRAKKITNPAATIHSSGLIVFARPENACSSTQLTKPAPMPFAIE